MPEQTTTTGLSHDANLYLLRSCDVTWAGRERLLVIWKRIQASDPQLAHDLDLEMGCLVVDAIREGFLAGYKLGRNPELLVFTE